MQFCHWFLANTDLSLLCHSFLSFEMLLSILNMLASSWSDRCTKEWNFQDKWVAIDLKWVETDLFNNATDRRRRVSWKAVTTDRIYIAFGPTYATDLIIIGIDRKGWCKYLKTNQRALEPISSHHETDLIVWFRSHFSPAIDRLSWWWNYKRIRRLWYRSHKVMLPRPTIWYRHQVGMRPEPREDRQFCQNY